MKIPSALLFAELSGPAPQMMHPDDSRDRDVSVGGLREYVVDGHRILLAYGRRSVSPKVLNIRATRSHFDKTLFAERLRDPRLRDFFVKEHAAD